MSDNIESSKLKGVFISAYVVEIPPSFPGAGGKRKAIGWVEKHWKYGNSKNSSVPFPGYQIIFDLDTGLDLGLYSDEWEIESANKENLRKAAPTVFIGDFEKIPQDTVHYYLNRYEKQEGKFLKVARELLFRAYPLSP